MRLPAICVVKGSKTTTAQTGQKSPFFSVGSRQKEEAAPTQNRMFLPLFHSGEGEVIPQATNRKYPSERMRLRAPSRCHRTGYVDAEWRTCHRKLRACFKNGVAGVTSGPREPLTTVTTAEHLKRAPVRQRFLTQTRGFGFFAVLTAFRQQSVVTGSLTHWLDPLQNNTTHSASSCSA